MQSNWLTEIERWWSQLEPLWIFLFALPLVVALAGLLAIVWRHDE